MADGPGRGLLVRKHFVLALFACSCIASRSHAQSHTAAPAALRSLGDRIDEALKQTKSGALDKLEPITAATLAVSASMLVDAGRCTDPSASGSAAESLLFT